MFTRQIKREATVETGEQYLTPDATVRRSTRRAQPKRLNFSPDKTDDGVTKKKIKPEKEKPEEKRRIKDEDVEDQASESHVGGLSEYELERLENIRKNQAFLSSINLIQAWEDLQKSKRPKQPLRSHTAKYRTLPARKSLRLQNKPVEKLAPPTEHQDVFPSERFKKPAGPLLMDPINQDEDYKLPPQLLELWSEETKESERKLDLKEYISALKSMKITEDNVVKVVKDRIFSAAFHPCCSSLLLAAGDKGGKVGLWNLGAEWGDDGVLVFEPHFRPVGCLAFSRSHPTQLLSTSYDGSLRCMDLEKAVFDDVYDIDEGLKTFAFMSHDCSTLLVGNWFGEVAIVDRRTPGNSHESLHTLDTNTVRCLNIHPLHMQYFVAAVGRTVSIYDSRYLKKTTSKPVSHLYGHSCATTGAYFSPCTGNRVLTSCLDNHIRIFDTSSLNTETPLLKSISHNMQTGRWLSNLSAVWDPKQEDCFVVGSMQRPRRVEVFHESGRLLHSFMDENLGTVLSVTAFHPTRNALLGGNSSGRMHAFYS